MSLASDFFSNFRSLIKSCGTLFSLFPVQIKKMQCKRLKSINYTNLHTSFWPSWYSRYIILHLLLAHVLALLEITLKRSYKHSNSGQTACNNSMSRQVFLESSHTALIKHSSIFTLFFSTNFFLLCSQPEYSGLHSAWNCKLTKDFI